jgi:hypothetical protein
MPDMVATPRSSSVIEIGYDDLLEEVYVRFRSGDLYAYQGVPEDVWEELCAAESTGTFVNKVIKRYPYRHLE